MKTRWMLLVAAVVVSSPLVAGAQYTIAPWSYVAYYEDEDSSGSTDSSWSDSGKAIYNGPQETESGYNSCVPPGYRVRDPWGNLLEPGIVAVSAPYDCTDTVSETGTTSTQIGGAVSPTEFAQLQDKVRELERRIDTLEGDNNPRSATNSILRRSNVNDNEVNNRSSGT